MDKDVFTLEITLSVLLSYIKEQQPETMLTSKGNTIEHRIELLGDNWSNTMEFKLPREEVPCYLKTIVSLGTLPLISLLYVQLKEDTELQTSGEFFCGIHSYVLCLVSLMYVSV